ncbi:23S rRNA pseudouridine(955/2504/2580) synthase RluC [Aliiglaciecola sp. SL4]|uniref:23S rRNA pseudouridine(955/2504/2580) synthase RluC n=1 Tax=Aliiglaciecola sp. SL4 TaxID=3239806 RepID=UPI00355BECD0
MTDTNFDKVQFLAIDEEHEGQRIDNFLRTLLKGVPKSMIYRIVRKGEVRVNKKRIKPEYKLISGDEIRLPPIRVSESNQTAPSTKLDKVATLESHILYEDEVLIVVNKPSGMAVHGGSGLSFGVIEALRALRPTAKFLELVHRLDRDTSGCLLIAKKRSALKHLHEQLRNKTVDKRYQALVHGNWPENRFKVKAPLLKNIVKSGERIVTVAAEGKESETRFRILESFSQATLVEASPITGRTHQIRVHCQHAGHPIAGDNKYKDEEFNHFMAKLGLHRLFLHAHRILYLHPVSGKQMSHTANLDSSLTLGLNALRKREA